jgi:short-subunit dehydrogenase
VSNNFKKIWITGASSGIGKALAEKFAKENWKVAISARRESLLNEIAKEENITAFPLDITKNEEVKNTFSKIINDFGDIDICVFCSAIYNRKNEKEINVAQIAKTIEVNFLGNVNCVKTVESHFKNRKNGQISLVSSVAAYRGLPSSSGYGPSKAALTNFAESVYFDFKKYNVKVTIISPGFIKTPMTDTNEFPMPFIRSADFAAEKIYEGLLKKNIFEITFPKQLTIILKILRILPYSIYMFLVDKLIKR